VSGQAPSAEIRLVKAVTTGHYHDAADRAGQQRANLFGVAGIVGYYQHSPTRQHGTV
jgi:hypothetical protein